MKLKAIVAKNAVAHRRECMFFGPGFTSHPNRRLTREPARCFKRRVREFTRRNHGASPGLMAADLRRYLVGWRAYFGHCRTPSALRDLDSWIHRLLRSVIRKRRRLRFAGLRLQGVGPALAAKTARFSHDP